MKAIVLTFLFLFTKTGYAQSTKQIEVNAATSVQVLKFMISHLEEYPLNHYPAEDLVKNLIQINTNLKGLADSDTRAFLRSELFKVLFDFDQSDLIDAKNIYISGAHINAAKNKYKKNEKLLTKFSKYIVLDMLENFSPYLEDNYINNYLNSSNPKYNQPEKFKEINLLNKHVGPWIMLYTRYDSKKFNQLCSKYVKNYFTTVAHLSRFFQFQKLSQTGTDIFTMPDSSLDELLNKLNRPTSEESSEEDQEDPKKAVEKLTLEPGEGASEKIDQIIEKLDQKAE